MALSKTEFDIAISQNNAAQSMDASPRIPEKDQVSFPLDACVHFRYVS